MNKHYQQVSFLYTRITFPFSTQGFSWRWWHLFISHILICNSTLYVQYVCVHLIPLFFRMYLFLHICLKNSLYCFPFPMNKTSSFQLGREVVWFSNFHKGNLTLSFSFSSGDLTLIQCYHLIHSLCSNLKKYPYAILYS